MDRGAVLGEDGLFKAALTKARHVESFEAGMAVLDSMPKRRPKRSYRIVGVANFIRPIR